MIFLVYGAYHHYHHSSFDYQRNNVIFYILENNFVVFFCYCYDNDRDCCDDWCLDSFDCLNDDYFLTTLPLDNFLNVHSTITHSVVDKIMLKFAKRIYPFCSKTLTLKINKNKSSYSSNHKKTTVLKDLKITVDMQKFTLELGIVSYSSLIELDSKFLYHCTY